MEFKQTIYDRDDLVDIENALNPGDLVLFEGNNQYDVAVYIHRNGKLEQDEILTTQYTEELFGGRKSKKTNKKKKTIKKRKTIKKMKKN